MSISAPAATRSLSGTACSMISPRHCRRRGFDRRTRSLSPIRQSARFTSTACAPRLVVCDLDLMQTLDPREVRSGTSEVIKYGAVCSAALFEQLERGDLEKLQALDPAALTDIVAQCVALKARVVEQDEFDKKGIR